MTKDKHPLIERARAFAQERHAHLHRPNKARQPATEHLRQVATAAQRAGATPEAVAAAWLHDVREDTPTTHEEILTLFGPEVAELVDALTDPPDFAPLPLAQRKRLQTQRISQKPPIARLVKLCDQLSNVASIAIDPPSDWDKAMIRTYADGAAQIAAECAGLSPLIDRAFRRAYAAALAFRKQD